MIYIKLYQECNNMKTIIIFSTKRQTTKKCVQLLEEKMDSNVVSVELKKNTKIDLSNYENVIIGGSIYMGMLNRNLKKFILNNQEILLSKNLGLFVCAMAEKDELEEEIKANFPKALYDKAQKVYCLGGAFKLEEMNFLERFIVKKVAKIKESVSYINEEEIKELSSKFV